MRQVYKCFLSVLIVFGVACSVVSAQEDWMPDPYLQRAVRFQLGGIPDEIPLVPADMKRLLGLDTWAMKITDQITDLTGLEHATNMTVLVLINNRIQDISSLATLSKLTFLDLGGNWITDIRPLEGLIRLETLRLWSNRLTDISPLKGLVNLKELMINDNQITDFTPLLGLRNLEVLRVQGNPGDITPLLTLNLAGYQVCDVRGSLIAPRIANREYPSVFAAWMNIINLPTLTEFERLARHDLYFCCPMFGLGFVETEEGIKLVGDIEGAMKQRKELQAQNPNLILLAGVGYFSGLRGNEYPEDWPLWLRDENGNRVTEAGWGESLLDFTRSETQERTIRQAVAVSKCGLFDGIFLDH